MGADPCRARDAEFDRYVDRWGAGYDTRPKLRRWGIFPGVIAKRARRRRALCLALLDPKPGERIVDLGCDGGHFRSLITERQAQWIGIDLALEMLRDGLRRGGAHDPRAAFINASATAVPIKPASVDAVIAIGLLNYFRLPVAAAILEALRRAVKPGGRLIVTNIRLDPLTFLRSRLPSWVPHPIRVPGPIYPHPPAALRPTFNAAGLRLARAERVNKYGLVHHYTMFHLVREEGHTSRPRTGQTRQRQMPDL